MKQGEKLNEILFFFVILFAHNEKVTVYLYAVDL